MSRAPSLALAFALSLGLAGLATSAAPARAGSFDWIGHVELDAEGLSSEAAPTRAASVRALAAYDINLTESYLLAALNDTALEVRLDAARALAGGRSLRAVPVLIEWLGDVEPKTRIAAADALGAIGGPQASAALARSLGDPDHTVRQCAVRALGALGKRGDATAVIAILPRLSDDKADVRRAAVEQLEGIGDRRAVIPLVAAFSDNHPEVRKAAVRAIGRFGDASVVPALLRLLRDPSEDVRSAAVGSLGAIGSTEAIGALSELLVSGSDMFRSKVAYALGQIAHDPAAGKAGEAALERLVAALATPSLRVAAREALRVAGPAAIPALLQHLAGKLPGDPTTAVQLLAKAGDRRATAALTAELERRRVAQPIVLAALGATGDPDALIPVLGALASKDPEIRLAAMNAMRPLLGDDGRASDVLIERLADPELEVRVLAAEYLGLVRARQATSALIKLTEVGTPPRLRHAAIDALGEIGDPRALPALLRLLQDGPAALRSAAATAVAYLGDVTAIEPLTKLIATSKGSAGAPEDPRRFLVRALGGSLRAHRSAAADSGRAEAAPAVAPSVLEAARRVLVQLAEDGEASVAVPAIAALAAGDGLGARPALLALASRGAPDRRRAALTALADLREPGGLPLALDALGGHDDRVAGDAAWAAAQLALLADGGAGAAPADKPARTGALAAEAIWDRFAYAARHGGWATQINATAGMALLASRLTAAQLTPARLTTLHLLTFHRSPLVRANVGLAVVALGPNRNAELKKDLLRLLEDRSAHLRLAVGRALRQANATSGSGAAPAELTAALAKLAADPSELVRAGLAAKPAPAPPEWRIFEIVDVEAGDAPVRQQRYFLRANGLVRALYTDGNGEITGERMPGGEAELLPASREAEP